MPRATFRCAQRVRRKRRTVLVACAILAMATGGLGSTSISAARGAPVVTLFAIPGGTSSTCSSAADACDLAQAVALATAPDNNGDPVVVMARPGTYSEPSIEVDAGSLSSLIIEGPGASSAVLRSGLEGAFQFSAGSITLSGFDIDGSRTSAVDVLANGGPPGTELTVADDWFTGDSGMNGGAIAGGPGSDITVSGDTFVNDTATLGDGGAVFSQGALIATDDTFSHDDATQYGGAVFAQGTVIAIDDTFADDSASSGGAIATEPSPDKTAAGAALTNDTFAGDTATAVVLARASGGAVANLGSIVSATQDTFVGDAAASGRGAILLNEGTVTFSNSVLDVPQGSLSCDGSTIDAGYNVESDDSCGFMPTDDPPSLLSNNNIELSPVLAANGSAGPQTIAMTPGSSAYGEVPAAACRVSTDERGWPRPGLAGQNCDAGAFEYFELTVEVSGVEAYLSGDPTFSFSDNAPPGLSIEGVLTCSTADAGRQISTLGLGDYTIDGSSCSGLSLVGAAAQNSSIAYTGAPDGFVIGPAALGGNFKLASNFIGYAESVLGDPYGWGQGRSKDATSFDCSGLVVYSLLNVGYASVPPDTYTQFAWATPITVQEAFNTPGALVFGQFGEDGIAGPGHVAISLGNGSIIEAAHTGTNVSIVAATLTATGILTTGEPDVGDLFTRAGLIPGLDYNVGIDGNYNMGVDGT